MARDDPLNVHQLILRHLKKTSRAAVASVYDMAKLVVDTCVGLFDSHFLRDDLQFFDFFEHEVARVVSSLGSPLYFSSVFVSIIDILLP